MNGQKIVYDVLEQLSIPYDYYAHPAVPTVEEASKYWKDISARHCKNLFFRNHKGNRHYLVIAECSRTLEIRLLEGKLKQGKLTFASEARMEKYLGLKPGSVSPFGLLNDVDHHVHVFLDTTLKSSNKISFHPNDNTASLVIPYTGFLKYLEYVGNSYEYIDFG